MDFIASSWRLRIPELARAVVDSTTTEGAQAGANDWLLATPKAKVFTIPDAQFRLLLRARLQLCLVPDDSPCA